MAIYLCVAVTENEKTLADDANSLTFLLLYVCTFRFMQSKGDVAFLRQRSPIPLLGCDCFRLVF